MFPTTAGARTVRENLTDALLGLWRSREVAPVHAALDPQLVALIDEDLSDDDLAELARELRPAEGHAHRLAGYLRAEQRLGRLKADVNCEMTALCLLATVQGLAMTPGPAPPDDLVAAVVHEHVRLLVEGAGRA